MIVCCRADDSNRNLVDAEFMAALGPRGVLVNVARGSVVDQLALLDALRHDRIGGAALDVFAAEPASAADWAGFANVVLAPHAGGVAQGAIARQRAMLRDNLDRFRADVPLLRRLV